MNKDRIIELAKEAGIYECLAYGVAVYALEHFTALIEAETEILDKSILEEDIKFWRSSTARANGIIKQCDSTLKKCLPFMDYSSKPLAAETLLKIQEYYNE